MEIANLPLTNKIDFFVTSYKGKKFLTDLADYLAREISVNYVLIGYPEDPEHLKIRAAALYANGKMIENYSYPLAGTPCENVMGRNCCYFPSNIQSMYPDDKELQELNIHSYIGIPIFSEDRKPLGLIALMDEKMIENPDEKEKALRSISSRLAKELKFYCRH